MKSILKKLRDEPPKGYDYFYHLFQNRARPEPYLGHDLQGYIRIGMRGPKQNQVTALYPILRIMPWNEEGDLLNPDPVSCVDILKVFCRRCSILLKEVKNTSTFSPKTTKKINYVEAYPCAR